MAATEMKRLNVTFVLLMILAGATATELADARDHSHRALHRRGIHTASHIGVVVGGALLPPWYYYSPYYPRDDPYYPRTRAAPYSPPTYSEQTPATSLPSQQPSYWYCADSKSYYPDITQCPGGWQQVVPRAPPPPPPD